MTEQQKPDALTTCSPEQVYNALWKAWLAFYGVPPHREQLLVVVAHWAFETAWGHGMHCFNLGNFKWTPGCGFDFVEFRASEVVQGREVFSVMRFKAYTSLDAGAADYLTRLVAEFRKAWPAVQAADAVDFCHQLKLQGYYTADEGVYTRGLTGCLAQLQRLLPAPAEAPTQPDLRVVAQGAVQQAAATIPMAEHDDDLPDPPTGSAA